MRVTARNCERMHQVAVESPQALQLQLRRFLQHGSSQRVVLGPGRHPWLQGSSIKAVVKREALGESDLVRGCEILVR